MAMGRRSNHGSRYFPKALQPVDDTMSHQSPTRRHFLQVTAAQCLGLSCVTDVLGQQSAGTDNYQPLNRFPRMVHEFYVDQVRASEKRNLEALARLKTQDDARGYVESARARIRRCFGPEPPRTPLNPRVTGVVHRDSYRIENVIFDSRPGFPVTANLYIPVDRKLPAPAVVGTCGHSVNGKAAEAYQAFAQGLARLGYVCLIYDPIGQGERLQYVNEDLSPRLRPGTTEHLYAGNQQFLVGELFCMWRAWDGIRALDYLLTRKEVDPQHLGVTGNSGGGTMTTWLCGVEPRWTMAAPSCFVTTFRRNLENELPADTEQCPPQALALGLDHHDFLAAMAPKPIIILGKERDYFDARGTEEAYRRLKRLYGLLGAEQNVELFIGPTYHGYSQENREAMYHWFNRASGRSAGGDEPEIILEADETLWCTPRGQVAEFESTRTVFDFTRDKSRTLTESRGRASGQTLRRSLRNVLQLPPKLDQAPDYRIWRYLGSRGYPSQHAIAYAVETEPGIHASVYRLMDERWYSRPPRSGAQAILYVAHLSSDAELREEPLLDELRAASPSTALFTCDVRGIGESQPRTTRQNSFHQPYGSDYFYAIHGVMLGRPYLGQKTWDVLRVLDWLGSLGHDEVHLVGKGWGSLPATFAAVLSERVAQVTLKDALKSYSDIAESEEYSWPLSALLPNVLEHFDLPDCYGELEAKRLRLLESSSQG